MTRCAALVWLGMTCHEPRRWLRSGTQPSCHSSSPAVLPPRPASLALPLGLQVRSVATTAMTCLTESLDPALLVQHMAHCVSHGQLRGKPLLVERLQV